MCSVIENLGVLDFIDFFPPSSPNHNFLIARENWNGYHNFKNSDKYHLCVCVCTYFSLFWTFTIPQSSGSQALHGHGVLLSWRPPPSSPSCSHLGSQKMFCNPRWWHRDEPRRRGRQGCSMVPLWVGCGQLRAAWYTGNHRLWNFCCSTSKPTVLD